MSFGSLPSVLGNGGGVAISVIGGRGLFADGTAAAPSISFSADPDTGFYRAAANQIRLALGGNGVYTFTSTGNISSTATGATLLLSDATGAIGLTAAGTNQDITLTPSGLGQVIATGSRNTSGILKAFNTNNSGYSAMDAFDETNTQRAGFGYGNSGSVGFLAGVAYAWTNTGIDYAIITNNTARRLVVKSGGNVLIGTTTDSGALLQIGTNTVSSTGGIVFGTDVNLFRSAAGEVTLNATTTTFGTSAATIKSANGALTFQSVGGQIVLTPSAGITTVNSRLTIAAGYDLRLGNAYVAGAVVGTGYVTIQDSTGTTYRVPVLV